MTAMWPDFVSEIILKFVLKKNWSYEYDIRMMKLMIEKLVVNEENIFRSYHKEHHRK